jgi:hypothetical protein
MTQLPIAVRSPDDAVDIISATIVALKTGCLAPQGSSTHCGTTSANLWSLLSLWASCSSREDTTVLHWSATWANISEAAAQSIEGDHMAVQGHPCLPPKVAARGGHVISGHADGFVMVQGIVDWEFVTPWVRGQ